MEYIWLIIFVRKDEFIVEMPHLIYNFHIILFFEMELSETYDARVEVRNHHYENIRHIDTHQHFRNMSPKAEKDQLIRKI